jgi:hypothetical protein
MAASKFITALGKSAQALTQAECFGAWHQYGREDNQMPQHLSLTRGLQPWTGAHRLCQAHLQSRWVAPIRAVAVGIHICWSR